MPFRPWALVWTTGVGRIAHSLSHFGSSRGRVFLEELRIVVNRLLQMIVSVIQLERSFALGVEIKSPFNRKGANGRDRQWDIVSVFKDYCEFDRVRSRNVQIKVLRDDRRVAMSHVDTTDFADCELSTCRIEDANIAAKVLVIGWNLKSQPVQRHLRRNIAGNFRFTVFAAEHLAFT